MNMYLLGKMIYFVQYEKINIQRKLDSIINNTKLFITHKISKSIKRILLIIHADSISNFYQIIIIDRSQCSMLNQFVNS